MSRPKERGPCFRCGASLAMSNCVPVVDPCPDCGLCACLRRYREDYQPETDWTLP